MRSSPPWSVIVIGSGPVGAAAACRLAERGCATLLLEAGRPIPLADVPGAPAGEHLRNQPRYQRHPEAFLAAALSHCAFYDCGAPPEGLPGACETIAVGGQGVLWTNNCPRTQPGVDRWAALDDATWERRYGEAEAMLWVATDQFAASERQRRIAAHLIHHLRRAAPASRRVEPLPMAGRRDDRGGVHFTATADLWAGLRAAAERLTVRSAAPVLGLEHRAGRVTAVRTADSAESLTAAAVLVAAGAFATPRLLYASGIRPPALGRWLHYHPLLCGQLVLDAALAAPPGAVDPPPRLWIPPTRRAPWHAMVLRDIGAGTPSEPVEEGRLVELQFFAPIEPRLQHHMTLDGPTPRFAVRLADGDRATLAAMRDDLLAVGAALGRWRAGCAPDWNPWGLSHPMGTTRMGDDPTTSVVDRRGRVHGFDNLYLCGLGVIPGPIAINPTLTAVALALETADHLAATVGAAAAARTAR